MKHFKHLNRGMSLIEVMVAIAIFAIFGSSLFVMQQYIFNRILISQTKLIASLRMQEQLGLYQVGILKELCDYEHGSIEKSLQEKSKDFDRPDMVVKITTKSKFTTDHEEKESPFKDLKNLHLITVQSQDLYDVEKLYGKFFMFTYIPDIEKPKS